MSQNDYDYVVVRDGGTSLCWFVHVDGFWEFNCKSMSTRQKHEIRKLVGRMEAVRGDTLADRRNLSERTGKIQLAMERGENHVELGGRWVALSAILGVDYRNHYQLPRVRADILVGNKLVRSQYYLRASDLEPGQRANIVFPDLTVRAEDLETFLTACAIRNETAPTLKAIKQWNGDPTRRRRST